MCLILVHLLSELLYEVVIIIIRILQMREMDKVRLSNLPKEMQIEMAEIKLKTRLGSSDVAKRAKLPPGMPASHMSADWCPSYSTYDPVLC